MDKFVVPARSPATVGHHRRPIWDRVALESDGKFPLSYKHQALGLLIQSYSQVGEFKHDYMIGSRRCTTARIRRYDTVPSMSFREGISGLEFDKKGIYLASVSSSGCLTIHDFEALYCTIYGPKSITLVENEAKYILHIDRDQTLTSVRWNQANQDEVACTSERNGVLIFDIGYVSPDPVDVLSRRSRHYSTTGSHLLNGLSDVKFVPSDKTRLLASGYDGNIYMWDRRSGTLPCHELATHSHNKLNTIELDAEDRIVYGAGANGIIYAWDLRGGRASFAFQSHKEVNNPILISLRLSSMLEKITSLKLQTSIVSREIHSISFDPSCSNHLAFHLSDHWSGVVDVSNLSVTHVHCPPPAWLTGGFREVLTRRPAWLPTCSIYAAGYPYGNTLSLLDFSPSRNSACHVDFNDASHETSEEAGGSVKNQFVTLSSAVSVFAAHPFNGTIVAGSEESSLLFVSQSPKAPEVTANDEDS